MITLRVFHAIFSQQFYKKNIGFFLVTGVLIFGVLSGREHLFLAQYLQSSVALSLIPLSLWTLYIIKILRFNANQLIQKENQFCKQLLLCSPWHFWITILAVILTQSLPILGYALFLHLVSSSPTFHTPLIVLDGSLLGLVVFSVWFLSTKLRQQEKIAAYPSFLLRLGVRNMYPIILGWLSKNHLLTWAGTKIISLTILWVTLHIYQGETFDLRLMGLAVSLVATMHITLIVYIHRFENEIFSLLRHLPLSLARRGLSLLIVLTVIASPEMIFIITKVPLSPAYITAPVLIYFMCSIFLFNYGVLYLRSLTQAEQTKQSFFVMLGLFFLILFSLDLILLSSLLSMTGIIIWRKRYYQFEVLQ